METIFKYYEFSSFVNDQSQVFSGHPICYSQLNPTHFLIFEQDGDAYHLYVARYADKKEVGKTAPELLETLVEHYDKSIPAHRVILKRYFPH